MNKRKIPRSVENNNFLGFSVKENGQLETHITGGFGTTTDWPYLHRTLKKLKLVAHWENPATIDLMQAGRAILKLQSGVEFDGNVNLRKKIQDHQLKTDELVLQGLKMQGRLFKIEQADYYLSQDIFKNTKFKDKLVRFWYKLRHNVLPCNFTLSKWYNVESKCNLCQYNPESMAHLLNGCKQFSGLYSSRHDKLVNKYADELSKYWVFCKNNKLISTSLPDFNINEDLKCLKPDILLKNENHIYIVDVACPYDLYIQTSYNQKLEHYKQLCESIKHSGYQSDIIPLIVGSCGIIHKKCLHSFTKLGLPKTHAKGLCKFSSNSNILFANAIWARRCSLIF